MCIRDRPMSVGMKLVIFFRFSYFGRHMIWSPFTRSRGVIVKAEWPCHSRGHACERPKQHQTDRVLKTTTTLRPTPIGKFSFCTQTSIWPYLSDGILNIGEPERWAPWMDGWRFARFEIGPKLMGPFQIINTFFWSFLSIHSPCTSVLLNYLKPTKPRVIRLFVRLVLVIFILDQRQSPSNNISFF